MLSSAGQSFKAAIEVQSIMIAKYPYVFKNETITRIMRRLEIFLPRPDRQMNSDDNNNHKSYRSPSTAKLRVHSETIDQLRAYQSMNVAEDELIRTTKLE